MVWKLTCNSDLRTRIQIILDVRTQKPSYPSFLGSGHCSPLKVPNSIPKIVRFALQGTFGLPQGAWDVLQCTSTTKKDAKIGNFFYLANLPYSSKKVLNRGPDLGCDKNIQKRCISLYKRTSENLKLVTPGSTHQAPMPGPRTSVLRL